MAKGGQIVLTKDGKKGMTYYNEEPINGKLRVYIVSDDFQRTGEKLLCDPKKLTVKGYFK